MSRSRPDLVLACLLALAAAFVCVELVVAALGYSEPRIQDSCAERAQSDGGGIDATIQRIVLDGLDGAACRLDTTREELVLSLGSGDRPRSWDREDAEAAIRAGLERAVDEADERGDIPGFITPGLRRLVRAAPIEELIAGGISLRDLIG